MLSLKAISQSVSQSAVVPFNVTDVSSDPLKPTDFHTLRQSSHYKFIVCLVAYLCLVLLSLQTGTTPLQSTKRLVFLMDTESVLCTKLIYLYIYIYVCTVNSLYKYIYIYIL